ncbi:unnamed protein product [Paramecium pentaurelia]|uniref:C2H2-type domain-containing protein n=1 Tax=Paramecium pentaurelia TaxID=43138 RepID=A0A8S1TWL5_9CILI|nr:unnamed protein product [Paramecium pentaurelia]
MLRQKETDDSFDYPLDSPQSQKHYQITQNGIYSPSLFIQSSAKSKSIFQKRNAQEYQKNSTQHAKMNKNYVNDFDNQMQIHLYSFNINNNKCRPIHTSLCSLFRENNIEVKQESVKQDSSMIKYLETIQQQMQQLESSVDTLERKLSVNNQKNKKPIEQSNDHQLVYINQNVSGLVGRLKDILMQKKLLTTQTQTNPQENDKQTIYTFNKNLNKFSKEYKCRFCNCKFVKACSLGGHISRTHKEESKQQKQSIPIKKNKQIKKEKINMGKMK